MKKLALLVFVSVLGLNVASGLASAHVVVRPAEVLSAGFHTFTVGAPNERDQPYTSVRLVLPEGLKYISVTSKPEWQITTQKSGEGEEAAITEITWTGTTAPGFREEFSFSAQAPEEDTELQWKAYQTYADGSVVAWDLSESEQLKNPDGSPDFSKSGPFSATKVVSETEQEAEVGSLKSRVDDAETRATRSFYISIAAVVVGLLGVFMATKKR